MLNKNEMKDDITQLLNEYRIKVTGSTECENEPLIYNFIYRHDLVNQTGLLKYFYEKAYEKGFQDAQKSLQTEQSA